MQKLKKVLLIDDEETVNFINRTLIERTAFADEVRVEQTVDDAIAFLSSASADVLPELIFVDVNMPEKNGWDFLDLLGEISFEASRPAVIVVSSSLNPADRAAAAASPDVIDFISKPISVAKLEQIRSSFFPDQD